MLKTLQKATSTASKQWLSGAASSSVASTVPIISAGAEEDNVYYVRNPPSYRYKEIVGQIVAQEGWDNSIYCYDLWKRAFSDKDFCLWCAIDKETEIVVGTFSLAFHRKQEQLCQWSMYYVRPEYRKFSLGRKLWDTAMEELGNINSYCYGVESMWKKYAKHYNSDKFADWRLLTTYGKGCDMRPSNLGSVDAAIQIKPSSQVSLQAILNYDHKLTAGVNRDDYLREALNHPESMTLVATSNQSTSNIVGICQVRQLIGKRIGISMFYADNESIARSLLRRVLEQFPQSRGKSLADYSKIVYKTPSTNVKSLEMFSELVDNKVLQTYTLWPQFTKHALEASIF
uniref:N-acetyltransferase domain-containing protein n=1 Tax=Ditylenchus dipsaci TaxID=166011 RepID=A0A915DMC6_9BILA